MNHHRRKNYQQEDDEHEDSIFLNSPTNWLCQSFQPLSPSSSRRLYSTSYTTNSTDYPTRYDDQDSVGTVTTTTQNRSLNNIEMRQKVPAMMMYSTDYESCSPSTSKIIAPNVAKLSPCSTVDVVLHSNFEDAIILCSSDVLKMRSQYFESLLLEQEKSLPLTGQSEMKWRPPIVISESSPYEGAAFLECLHEGKGYCCDWNLCWARLRSILGDFYPNIRSGIWQIQDMKFEYTLQIENHVHKLFDIVQRNHWRVNPSVFVGSKIAIFRKTTGLTPAILTGFVVEGSTATPPSHVRVSFELEPSKRHLYSSLQLQNIHHERDNDSSSIASEEILTCSGVEYGIKNGRQPLCSRIPQRIHAKALKSYSPNQKGIGRVDVKSQVSTSKTLTLRELRDKILTKEEELVDSSYPLIGETPEPFWIQQGKDNQWEEPDVICVNNIEKLINSEDKRILWEMISLLIEFPGYYRNLEGNSLDSSESCHSTNSSLEAVPTLANLSNPSELAIIFHRREYQVLWTFEAPEYLPLIATQDLVRYAFSSMK